LATVERLPAYGAGPPAGNRVRPHCELRDRSPTGRQPEGRPRRRYRVCHEPAAGGGPVPPCGPRRRCDRWLPRRARGGAYPAHAGVGGMTRPATPWRARVEEADWARIGVDLDEYGAALIGPLLTAAETAQIAELYDDATRFRSTVNMGRHRFGEG